MQKYYFDIYFGVFTQIQQTRDAKQPKENLTVGLLVSGTGSGTAKLFGLALSWIGNKQGSVVLDQDVLNGLLTLLIDMLLVVCNEGLSKSLTDCINLGDATTTLDTDPDVNIIKALLSKEEDWLLELVLESLGFNLFKGFTVDIQKTLATLAVGNSSGSLLATKGLNRLDGFLSVSHLNKICVKVKASNNLN